jgi:peptidoglycan/LPS O-acetylase OafA/YrhL
MRPHVDIRVNNFDLLRLIAAIQVVVEHGTEYFVPARRAPAWDWVLQAFPGVPVFFVISGFLISLSYERSGSLGIYAQNRTLRIFPGLWVCLLVTVIAFVGIGGIRLTDVPPVKLILWAVAQLTVGQFYNASWLRDYGSGVMNGSLWTIPVELQFYALIPVVYGAFRLKESRSGTGVLLGLAALTWVCGAWFGVVRSGFEEAMWFKLLGVTFLPYVYLFLIGVLIQRNWERVSVLFAGRWLWWLIGYAIVAVVLHRAGLRVGTNWPHPLGVPFLVGLVFSLAYSAPQLADKLLRRNDVSYGVYIYHMPVINVFLALGVTGGFVLVLPALAVTLVLAAASWAVIERPMLRLKKQTLHQATVSTS